MRGARPGRHFLRRGDIASFWRRVKMELSMGKVVPAAILLVTAYQLLSDRNTLFGSPKPTVWTAPSTDGGGGSSSGDGSSTTAATTTSSGSVQHDGGDPLKLPEGYKPIVAEPCSLEPERPLDWQGHILAVAGGPGSAFNVKHTAQECWESCHGWPGCQSWYWCDQREGCMDAEGRQYPFKGCELRAREVIRRLGQVPASWRLPTFATGFMRPVVPTQQVGAFTVNEQGGKVIPSAAGGLIMTTSLWPKPCVKKYGELINQLSVVNKLDYVRLHGYEFHLFTQLVDKSLPKLYSKVGLLRKLLAETSRERAEWILWIDADTIIQELAFQMPLHLYTDKSLVVWGNKDYLDAGDQRHGINTGILLLRNDMTFSPKFWKDVALVSRINQNVQRNSSTLEGQIKAELEDQVQISTSFEDLCDQNVIVYLLRTKSKEYMPQTLLEDGRFCLSCWFKDVPKEQSHAPFVNHWAACQMCTESIPPRVADGGNNNEWSTYCREAFMDNFAYANRTMSMLLGCEQDMIQWGPPLGLPVNDWFDCTDKRGLPTCPPLPPTHPPPPDNIISDASNLI